VFKAGLRLLSTTNKYYLRAMLFVCNSLMGRDFQFSEANRSAEAQLAQAAAAMDLPGAELSMSVMARWEPALGY